MLMIALMATPLVFALLLLAAPAASARAIAMGGTLLCLAGAILAAVSFPWSDAAGFHFAAQFEWLPALGITFSVGIDSVSMMLILLTALLGPICVAASTTAITERVKTYYFWLLVLMSAMVGVFASRDIILFYVCFEFTLVPMFILISLYGSTNRRKASIKFFLYTFTGSVIALAGLVYIAWHAAQETGVWSFDIAALESYSASLPLSVQSWLLLALLAGFAVKVPLFPVHTWLPLAHTEAPTAGSVILAGVLLKLGTYGMFRFVLPFVPAAVIEFAPIIATLCIIGILYGGLICWVQTDVKKLVAYSSVAHLGFCVLGLFALNHTGITGSITYMINHGLSTSALFLLIGMMYERYHTRNMREIGGLARKMPIWATFLVFFTMASVGLPGLNGFVSEFLCLMGTFQASSAWGSGVWGSLGGALPGKTAGDLGPWYALVAGTGMIVAAMFLLYMLGKIVWGPLVEPAGHGGHGGHGAHAGSDSHAATLPPDLNRREILTLVPLAILCLVLGVYPRPMLQALQTPIERVVQRLDGARMTPEAAPVQVPVTSADAASMPAPMPTSSDQPLTIEPATSGTSAMPVTPTTLDTISTSGQVQEAGR